MSRGLRPPTVEVSGPSPGRGTLGTFGGVFTPSMLTILGVIMYLRFGWVVGNVGLLGTLMIVTLSTAITFLTSLSIAQIATDQVVRVGGAYYMISRSLGIETGGAVGIPLYFAQALSVALYTVGFAESVSRTFPALDQRAVGIATTIAVALLAWKSARIAIRAQYLIMALIALSLVSLFLGSPLEPTTVEMWGAPAEASAGFWVVFAVFFPAVTGIMAGVNMSGDLRDPARSIPRGTLAAVGVGYAVYMLLPIYLALRADATTLIEDPLVMRRIAWWGDAILLGVWGATLSSAVGSILGAPRVLQALARDGVLPRSLRFLGRGSGDEDEPRIGTVVTLGVALLAVALGNLDVIAPILTMFFLTTYLVLNLAAGLERLLQSPSFRPTFEVHWGFSFLGAAACLAVMFLVNAAATVVATVVVVSIYLWLEGRELQAAWGDLRRGIWMALVRAGLVRVEATPDPKNWRPHLLVLSGAPSKRWRLVDFATSVTHNRALMTVATVIPEGSREGRQRIALEATIRDYLARRGVLGLVRVVAASDPFVGAERLVEAYGLGSLTPNTVLMGASESEERRDRYCDLIAAFHRRRRNVVVLNDPGKIGFPEDRERIDVWWGGLADNGGLMLILAYLLRTSVSWQGAEVRLKLVVDDDTAVDPARRNLERVVAGLRLGALPDVIAAAGRSFDEILRTSSRDADLVFLGMAEPGPDFRDYYDRLVARVRGLPPTAFVLAAEDLPFSRVLSSSEPGA